MKGEMESIYSNQFYELVKLLPNREAIENKWIFHIRHKTDDTIDKHKL